MRRLDQFGRDSKVEHPLGHHLRRRLDALRHHADLGLQLVVDARLPQSWKLCAVREFDHKLRRAEQLERNWSGTATFFVVAHVLGKMRLMAQRLAKSTLDGPYEQFIHTALWII
jgi:hypothetical protein